MRLVTILIALVGIAVSTATIIHEGAQRIFWILSLAGWPILLLAPLHVTAIGLDAVGWRQLLPDYKKPPTLAFMTWAAVIRESVDALLPVARIGGGVAGVDLLCAKGFTLPVSAASVVAELTITLITQALFTLIGAAILSFGNTPVPWIAHIIVGGMVLTIPFVVAVVLMQRRSRVFHWLGRTASQVFKLRMATVEQVARIDAELALLFRRYGILTRSCLWQLAGLVMTAAEVWLALALMGHPVTLGDAVIVESFGQALRSITFIVPAALGVQELGLIAFGALIGLPPDVSLALSLAKRLRDTVVGIPSLLWWLSLQGRHRHRH